jgi:hypothetical protein
MRVVSDGAEPDSFTTSSFVSTSTLPDPATSVLNLCFTCEVRQPTRFASIDERRSSLAPAQCWVSEPLPEMLARSTTAPP